MSKISDNFVPLQLMYISLENIKKIYYKERKGLNDYRSTGIICDGRNINLSRIMYKENYQSGRYIMINPKSYDLKYKIYVDTSLEILLNRSHLRPATINQTARQILYFIEYVKDKDFILYKDVNEAKNIYQSFTLYLLQRLRETTNPLNNRTSAQYQKAARLLISKLHNIEIGLIKHWAVYISEKKDENYGGFGDKENNSSSNELVINTLNTYYQIFNSLYDLLVGKKTFPIELVLPHRSLWVFPISNSMFNTNKINCINSKLGYVLTLEEAIRKSNIKDTYFSQYYSSECIENITKLIIHNNFNLITEERMKLAQTAMECFFMLFLGITGMNEAQALSLPWAKNDEFDINTEVAKFRAIKYRGTSEGKLVEFQIRSGFILEFKRFLELRRFRLNGAECNSLFFRNAKANTFLTNTFTKGFCASKISSKFFNRALITDEMKYVNARALRNFKSRILSKHNGFLVAAEALQHKSKTNQSNYNKVTVKEAKKQLSTFLDGLHEVIIDSKKINKIKDVQEVASGSCFSINAPNSVSDISADCNTQGEGCLFCVNYRLHADEKDVHKVLSLRYILEKSKQKSDNHNHFERELRPYIIRIDSLIDLISEKNNEYKIMVEKIKKDVNEREVLTEWYSIYLEMLYDIGALE